MAASETARPEARPEAPQAGFLTRYVGEEALRGQRIGAGVVLDLVDIAAGRIAWEFANGAVATVCFDRVDITSPVLHGDLVRLDAQLVNVGRSSMLIEVRVYRLDIARRAFIQAQYSLVTMVAIDESLRPRRIGKELLSPYATSPTVRSFIGEREALHKEIAARLAPIDAATAIDIAPLLASMSDHPVFERLPISATCLQFSKAFTPKNLNYNKTVFGGDVLQFMEECATVAARNFSRNQHMHTVSMSRMVFRIPLFIEDAVQLTAHVVYTRMHTVVVNVAMVVRRGRREADEGKVFVSHTGSFVLISLDEAGTKRPLTVGLDLAASAEHERKAYAKAKCRFDFWLEHRARFNPADYDAPWPHIAVAPFLPIGDAALWQE